VYKIDEIKPVMSFDVSSLHEANAIYELILSSIYRNIKGVKK